ncbi:hypothetical protein CANTEDRAFT_119656 [Yamadazyma tenuis ATCC 10573]|uniref:ferric-chelate reductase (NADPH) n=1 Tax=Candida tenuis (strain ATCC 10573 / BCRC 21748 / CBS 615 / JCM 9827 / NBRC 10315 / NRRL Y-1498 / VKM Y-70) TaxID=590646 RepID=G3B0B5_CANTC|nr:uncharacterized protein CANTEDRAFT_119656 [Yamadazyma tenuis ATCC 10573]EGV65361.1 hypothetical protein CANTEDRAFT_119656 [Yamadazyma tenuis ATCC 10573]
MYDWCINVTIGLLVCLTPFCIPIKLRNPRLRTVRTWLIVAFIISLFITFTPSIAVDGAPIHKYGEGKIAYYSCSSQVMKLAQFCPKDERYTCVCQNPNARASMAYCYDYAYSTVKYSMLDLCATECDTTLTRQDFDEALANYSKFSRDISHDGSLSDDQFVDFPVKLDHSQMLLYKRSYDQVLGNYDRSIYYGGVLILYWLVFFLGVSIINWSKFIFPHLVKRMVDPYTNWLRKHLFVPATAGLRKTNEKPFLKVLDFLVPTRLETASLTGFFILLAHLVTKEMHYVDGDPIFTSKGRAFLRYYAVRTSILTSSMMPLLILFGGRNNVLQVATRWDYSSFITLHRWISRMLVILITGHSLFYSLYTSDFYELASYDYIRWGILGTLSGLVLCVHSLLVLRRKYYEVFLLLHIVLALGFILGAYIHVMYLYCLWFYHFTFAVWIFDRVIRIGRLISFGFPHAHVMLLADEALKVVIPKPAEWETIPGGHVFLHFLRPSCFWQSHPFTYTISPNNPNEIVVFIKVKKGVTESLYHYLQTHPGKSVSIRVAVEGSYGEQTPASRYNSAMFVAGGNGIPGIFAEAVDLVRYPSNQKVRLIWVVREYRSLYWFYEELLSLKNTHIETIIYVTKPESYAHLDEFNLRFPGAEHEVSGEETSLTSMPLMSYGSSDSTTAEQVIDKIHRELSFITFEEGRPSMDGIVKHTIKESEGSAAFITCGHPVMVDDLRAAVVANIDNESHKRVDYFEQLQVWA